MPATLFWMLGTAAAAANALPSALASNCATCHVAPKAQSIPKLSNDADTLRRQLTGLRDGELPGTTMPRLLQGLSDADVDALVRELTTAGRDTP